MKYNYHGDKVAVCDSTGQIKVEAVGPNGIEPTQTAICVDAEGDLPQKAHQGPCFALDFFVSPSYDMLLASVGNDAVLKVWAQNQDFNTANNQWQVIQRHKATNSLGCVAFCPWEHGVVVVAGSADGSLVLLNLQTNDQVTVNAAHQGSINGLSWQPLKPGEESAARLVTAGSDAKLKIWRCEASKLTLDQEVKFNGSPAHSDWVRDVDWLKSGAASGLICDYIASVSEDKTLKIWKQKKDGGDWQCVFKKQESVPQWKCSWSPQSAMLAVSCGDNMTKVYQQTSASGDGKEEWAVGFTNSEAHNQ